MKERSAINESNQKYKLNEQNFDTPDYLYK